MGSPPIAFVSQRDFEVIDAAVSYIRAHGPESYWHRDDFKSLRVMALTDERLSGIQEYYKGLGLDERINDEIKKTSSSLSSTKRSLLNEHFSDPAVEVLTHRPVRRPLDKDPITISLPAIVYNESDAFLTCYFPQGRHGGSTCYHLQPMNGQWEVIKSYSIYYQ